MQQKRGALGFYMTGLDLAYEAHVSKNVQSFGVRHLSQQHQSIKASHSTPGG
jgi:hypothetical protein